MRRLLPFFLVLLLGLSPTLWAQSTIRSQSFETGEVVNYTSNTFDFRGRTDITIGNNQYFTITTTNPATSPADPSIYSLGNASDPVTIRNDDASATRYTGNFWIAEGVRGTNNTGTAYARDPGHVTLNAFSASGYTGIKVIVALADPRGPGSVGASGAAASPSAGSFQADDKIEIQYSTDGGNNYITIGRFKGNNNNGSSGYMELDYNLNDDVNDEARATLNYKMTDYTFGPGGNGSNIGIPGSPSSLIVRVVLDQRGTSQEIAFDNIRVVGTATTVQPPTLTDAQTGAVNYTEGDPATQITSTIVATNPEGANLTGATVSIISGLRATEDLLDFTAVTGITGSYAASTGVLTFLGTAPVASYQAVLRTVTYRNSNLTTARSGNRAIQFVVNNGASTSSGLIGNVLVKAILGGPATLPYAEDFTTDGEGVRYGSNTFVGTGSTGTGFGFTRTSNTPYEAGAVTFTNISNTFFWYGVNIKSGQNPSNVGRLETQPVDATRYKDLHFQIRLGAESGAGAAWQASDSFKMYYRTGGSSGTWKLFGSFRGNTTVTNGTGDLRQDRPEDLANLPTLPAGTAILTPTLTNYDFALPTDANAQLVDFKVELINDDIRAEFAFDLIQVSGTPTTTVNSIVRASANPTNAATVNYTVIFGTPVTGLTAANFTLSTAGSVNGATVGTPVAGAGNTWTVPVNTGTGSGTLALNLANDTNLSSGLTTTLPFVGETYTIDKTAPTVSSVAVPANGTYRATQTLGFTINFSEAVTVSGTPQLGLIVGSTSRQANYISGSGSPVLTFSYTVQNSELDGNGIMLGALTLNNGTLRDVTGNSATITLNGVPSTADILVDAVVPTVSISSSAGASGSTSTTTPVSFTVTFSETVTGFVQGDLTVSNGAISGFTAVSGTTYSVNVTPAANGAVTVNVPANVAQDAAGNPNTTASPYTITYSATPTITGFAAAPALVCVGGPLTFTATMGNLSAPYAFTLSNGSSTTLGTAASTAFSQGLTASGSGVQTFTLTVSSQGQVATATTALTVNAAPATPSLSSNGPLTCAQSSVTLTAGGGNTGGAFTYAFLGPGLRATGPNNQQTVSQAGNYSVIVTNANGCTATASTSVESRTAIVTISNPASMTSTAGQPFNQSFVASGGSGSYSYSLASGSLPTGLTLAITGVLSGTPTQAGSFTLTVRATDATDCSGVSAPYVLTLSQPAPTRPDLSPLLYARPSLVYGSAPLTVVVDVVELNSIATSGSLTVRLTKDPQLNLSFDASLSSLDGRAVQNSVWRFSASDPDYYILTTSQPIAPGDQLSLGLSGLFVAGASTGVLTVSATVLAEPLVEGRLTNNVDAEKVEYFQQ